MSFLNRDKRKEVASDITSQAAAQVANSAMADMQVATDLTGYRHGSLPAGCKSNSKCWI